MRKIRLILKGDKSYLVEIDGVQIEFTYRNNKLRNSDFSELSNAIDGIEHALTEHRVLNEFAQTINKLNVMRVLEGLFFDQAYALWEETYPRYYESGVLEFKEIFKKCFGFIPATHGKENLLLNQMHEYSKQYQLQKKLSKDEASFGLYNVKKEYMHNNVVVYNVNDVSLEVCIKGHKDMGNATLFLDAILMIHNGIVHYSPSELKAGIELMGSSTAMEFLKNLLHTETLQFFSWLANKIAIEERNQVYPRKLIKAFFGGTRHSYVNAILDTLEPQLIELEALLLKGNKAEILSNKKSWKLFDNSANGIRQYVIQFVGSENLIQECQVYLRAVAKKYESAKQPYALVLYTKALHFAKGISFLEDDLGTELQSIMDLEVLDVYRLLAFLVQKSGITLSEQRRILLSLRELYNFFMKDVTDETIQYAFEGFCFPKANPTHVKPTTPEALGVIGKSFPMLEDVIRLAFLVACTTGGRANSICELLVTSIKRTKNGYAISIFNKKTAITKLKKGEQTSTLHALPTRLAEELLDFIEKTKGLRTRLDKPYIFVYERSNLRQGTLRKPQVLDAFTFRSILNAILAENGICDSEGFIEKCSFKSIRAEVGRGLFASGATESEVANKLGNSAIVARQSYNNESPHEEAEKYRQQYSKTLDAIRDRIEEGVHNNHFSNGVSRALYGHCLKGHCYNNNACDACPQRVVCKKEVS